jgi:pantoate--beta-alanine ligase
MAEARETLARAGFVIDYFEARHAGTLEPIASAGDRPVRLLAAAKLGNTRLIDNVGVPDATIAGPRTTGHGS